MTRPLVVTLAACALFLGAAFAREAAAQTQPWNQEVTTALAGELEDAVSGLREAVRRTAALPNPQQKRKLYEIIDNLRMIEQSATSLHAELKKGEGMEATLPTYKRMQQIKRDTEVLAQQVDISAMTRPKLDKAQAILDKLAGYYPAEPPGPSPLP